MNAKQYHALSLRQTDVEGAVRRLSGNEDVYVECLQAFLTDETMRQINDAIKNAAFDDAFTAAHALKGVAGNMGFVPLMHAVGRLVVLIRGGRLKEIGESLEQVNSCYRDIIDGIHQFFCYADKALKGE